jgi:putative tryptophan/tyrosine transport system substrate-binding protein
VKRLTTWLAIAVALLLLVAPLASTFAQPAKKMPSIGYLALRLPSDPQGKLYLDAFLDGLRERGWVEGKNIVIEYRWAEGRSDRLADLAAELVGRKIDVIVALSTPAAVAAKNATQTIPIVMTTGGDPERLGLVASLGRPGGNVTGLSYGVGMDIFGKQMELLKEVVPKLRRLAILSNPANPSHGLALKAVSAAAGSLGLELQLLETRGPEEFDSAFAAMAEERADALLVLADGIFALHRARLQDLAARQRLAVMYGQREHVEAGGLMSYNPDFRDSFRRAATYVDKILRGAKPAELPVEQPTKFDLMINVKTAKALGIEIPKSMLFRADRVIE